MKSVLNILIIDDSEDDRELYRRLLEKDASRKWIIQEATGSKDGIQQVTSADFDCVLLDFSLPGEDGLQVLRAFKEKLPHTPIIMLTGRGDERIAVEAMKGGAHDYLRKGSVAVGEMTTAILSAIERQEREATLLHRASYDHLTGLVTRGLFMDRLKQAIARGRRHKKPFALLYMDFDKFKDVNDKLGHQSGDALLIQAASRMLECARMSDTVARLGGDEFAFILEELSDDGMEGAAFVAERIISKIARQSYAIDGQILSIDVSIGIAIFPTMAKNIGPLMELADRAMYEAKRSPDYRYKFADREFGGEPGTSKSEDGSRH